MGSIILTAISLVVGAVVTFFFSRYFYKKGVKGKSLTPYLQFIARTFSDIDPGLRRKLKIIYNDVEVENLYQVQFVIANTGDKPIRDCIEPLSLEVPRKGEVVRDVFKTHPRPVPVSLDPGYLECRRTRND